MLPPTPRTRGARHRHGVPALLAVRDADRRRERRALLAGHYRSRRCSRARSTRCRQRYGLPIDPRRLVHALSVGERQRVEIIRCLLQHPQPAHHGRAHVGADAAGGAHAVRDAAAASSQRAAAFSTSVTSSTRSSELCHRATVLRGGQRDGAVRSRARDAAVDGADDDRRRPAGAATSRPRRKAEIRLRVAGLSHEASDPFGTDLKDMHLDVRAGEIVGIAGISGNGQRELLGGALGRGADRRKISGADCRARGRPRCRRGTAVGSGSAFVPEDRAGTRRHRADDARRECAAHRACEGHGPLWADRFRCRRGLTRGRASSDST